MVGTTRPLRIFFYQLELNERYYSLPLIKGLRAAGCEVQTNDLKALSYDEEIDMARSFKPDLVIFYGFTFMNFLCQTGKSLFTEDLNIPYVTIFCDNPTRYLFYLRHTNSDLHITCCCDSQLAQQLRDLGYKNVHYLPLFFDPDYNTPQKPVSNFMHDLVFPGSVASPPDSAMWTPTMRQLRKKAINQRDKNPGQYVDYFNFFRSQLPQPDIPSVDCMAFAQLCSHNVFDQKHQARMELFDSLAPRPIHIYGLGDWTPNRPTIIHHDYLDQNTQLPLLYSSAKIILCLELLPACVHQRVYEVSGSKGFIISEYRTDYEGLFEPDKEIVMFKDLDDLVEKVDYYLENDTARQAVAKAAHKRVMAHHTVQHRAKDLLNIVEGHR